MKTTLATKPPEWYRRRGYAHFDWPLTVDQAVKLATSPTAVSSHGFHPIIVFPKKVVRRKTQKDGKRIWAEKIRPLAYVAHSDAHIHAKYANDISSLMESRYSQGPGNKSVIAYRKLDGKCNIDFAYDCFTHIKSLGECEVVAIDIRGFFDSLDSQYLKQQWASLLGCPLPDDHYAVFKSVTRDYAILLPTLRDILGGEVPRRSTNSTQCICKPEDFRSLVVPNLQPRHSIVSQLKGESDSPKGIPQGTPISAVLANLYMYDVDKEIEEKLLSIEGFYRRYSDDILVIVRAGHGAVAEQIVRDSIVQANLTIHTEKTERHFFRYRNGQLECQQADEQWNLLAASKMNYLGFAFDGQDISIRNGTISSFIERMKRAVRRGKYAALKNGDHKIRKRQIYAKLSPLGWGSKYGDWDPKIGPPRNVPRMGFHRYLKLAANRMKSELIRKQGRQLENLLYRTIAKEQEDLTNRLRKRKQKSH